MIGELLPLALGCSILYLALYPGGPVKHVFAGTKKNRAMAIVISVVFITSAILLFTGSAMILCEVNWGVVNW